MGAGGSASGQLVGLWSHGEPCEGRGRERGESGFLRTGSHPTNWCCLNFMGVREEQLEGDFRHGSKREIFSVGFVRFCGWFT
jgi:hypothetical protein